MKQELIKELKEAGLEVAEESLEAVVKIIFSVGKKSIPIQFSALLSPMLDKVEEYILEKIETIDGEID